MSARVYLLCFAALLAAGSTARGQSDSTRAADRDATPAPFSGPSGTEISPSASREIDEPADAAGLTRRSQAESPAPLALARPGEGNGSGGLHSSGSWWGLLGALSLSAALLLAVVWGMQKIAPGAQATLPEGVVEVFGRASLGPRRFGQVVRFGDKVLLLNVTPAGCETLAEVDDPREVERIAALCERRRPSSSTQTFAAALKEAALGGGKRTASARAVRPASTEARAVDAALRPSGTTGGRRG